MKHLRKLSLLLVLAMLATTACGKDGNSDDTEDAGTTSGSAVDTEAEGEKLELPDDITSDYDEISILNCEGTMHGPDEFTDDLDTFHKAMYERRKAVEDRFGIELSFTDATFSDTPNRARQSINSGSDDYQMTFMVADHSISFVNEGLFLPLSELPYIDLEKPWWNKQYISSISLHEDDQYVLFGDICWNMLQRTTCVFFNIPLLEEKLNMQPQDLYDLVYEGKWTIDKMAELVSQVYVDDGNTINDENDIHGLVIYGPDQMNWMAFSSGLDFTSRNEEGYPELNLNNEATLDLIDKLMSFLVNNEAVYNHKDNHGHVWKFSNGNALFLQNRIFLTSWEQLRTMKDDYGILPMPKYNEDIDGYHSVVEQNVQWGTVPVTVTDPAFVSAVAEALAYESRLRVTPAYYETTLKLKQTRDDASMEMIDMIMAGRDTDYLFINPLGGMDDIFKNIFNAGQNNFASQYARLERAANANLRDLIAAYEERY